MKKYIQLISTLIFITNLNANDSLWDKAKDKSSSIYESTTDKISNINSDDIKDTTSNILDKTKKIASDVANSSTVQDTKVYINDKTQPSTTDKIWDVTQQIGSSIWTTTKEYSKKAYDTSKEVYKKHIEK